MFDRCVDQLTEVLCPHHVGRHGQRPSPEPGDLGGHAVDVVHRARRAHDVRPRFCEADGDAAPNSLARAGDDRDASVEAEPVQDHFAAARPAISGSSR